MLFNKKVFLCLIVKIRTKHNQIRNIFYHFGGDFQDEVLRNSKDKLMNNSVSKP